jgi:hypothetical protein
MVVELGRGVVLVADVRHEDRVIGGFDRTGDGRPRGEQRAQGLPFASDPDPALDLAAEPRLLLQRDADPPLLDELAVPVERLVSEVAPVERVVDLQRRQFFTGRARIRAHEVHARFLAALDGSDDPFDEPFVEEVLDDFVRQRGCSFIRRDTDMSERRVLRELPRSSRTAQREREGRCALTVTVWAVISHPSFLVWAGDRRVDRAERAEYTRYRASRSFIPAPSEPCRGSMASTTATGMCVTARNPSPSGRISWATETKRGPLRTRNPTVLTK